MFGVEIRNLIFNYALSARKGDNPLISDCTVVSISGEQTQGRIQDFKKGGSFVVRFADFISFFPKYPMKMK